MRTFWVRASVERASRESVAFPLEPAPGSRSRAPAVPTADDPPTTRLASFIRRDPVVPPRSPSRPPPLNLAQDVELAAGRVAVADGPMRARPPRRRRYPRRVVARPRHPRPRRRRRRLALAESRDTSTNPPSRPPNPRFSTRTIVWCSWINRAGVPSCAAGWGRASRAKTTRAGNCSIAKDGWSPAPNAGWPKNREPEPALVDQLFAVNRVDKPVSGVWILAKG